MNKQITKKELVKSSIITAIISIIITAIILVFVYFVIVKPILVKKITLSLDDVNIKEDVDNKEDSSNQDISYKEPIKEEDNKDNKEDKDIEIKYIYRDVEKEVIVEKETSRPLDPTDAIITYRDSLGNTQTLNLPKNTTINFSAGEHGLYNSVPSPITLSSKQELDITTTTTTSYDPDSIEVNYIFKGFSYSGDTFKAEYAKCDNPIDVKILKYDEILIDNNDKEYVRLDCLRTSGTQYINLGQQTIEQANVFLETKFKFVTLSVDSNALWLFSCQLASSGSTYPFDFYSQNSKFIGRIMNGTTSFNHDSEIHTLIFDGPNTTISLDGEEKSVTINSSVTGNFNLFRRNTGIGYGSIYLYSFIYSKGDEVVFNLIPVEGLNGEGKGLLNSVDKKFYPNSGTGNFGGDILISSFKDAGYIRATGSYETGTSLDIEAIPNSGYEFVKWSDGETNSSRTITIGGNNTYEAIFKGN